MEITKLKIPTTPDSSPHNRPQLELLSKPAERSLPFSELARLIQVIHSYSPSENTPETVEEAVSMAREYPKEALDFWLDTAQSLGIAVTLGRKLSIVDIRTGASL